MGADITCNKCGQTFDRKDYPYHACDPGDVAEHLGSRVSRLEDLVSSLSDRIPTRLSTLKRVIGERTLTLHSFGSMALCIRMCIAEDGRLLLVKWEVWSYMHDSSHPMRMFDLLSDAVSYFDEQVIRESSL